MRLGEGRGGRRPARLVRKAEFDRVYTKGRRYVDRVAVLHVLSNGLEASRAGYSVSRRIGGAVERNRVKRRLREAVRGLWDRIPAGFDLVFTARAPVAEVRFGALRAAVARLLAMAGVLLGPEE